ncbi:MAG TPA: TetR/AcrR family transcriptional regulator [Alphaproteobacteria bacterium]|nr:TetR/AcrR family transcriptional regulator [Alphaproteobacteria bacterium]
MRPARQPKDDPRLEQILEAATDSFLANGYADTSIDAIAKAAKVSKQTIYELFRDKADIFRRVVARDMERFHDLPDLRTDRRKPELILAEVARWLSDTQILPRNIEMYRLLVATAQRFPDLATAHNEYRVRTTLTWLSDYLAALAERRRIRIDDPQDMARRFAVLVTEGSRMLMGYPARSERERRDIERRVIDLFMRGLTPKSRPRKKTLA